jgi:hypothetical protein
MTLSLVLAIGVAHVHGLPELTGVRSGVYQFETWARTQGFDTLTPVQDGRSETGTSLEQLQL